MTSEELRKNLLTLLSSYKENAYANNFMDIFNKRLSSYISWTKELEIGGLIINEEWIQKIEEIGKKIREIINSSLNGKPSTAYDKLRNLLSESGLKSSIDIRKLLITLKSGTNFYRIRKVDTIYKKGRCDLFHIPFEKRGYVKTERYSSPGYPCLYLGESIYGCWEEMRRPDLSQCAVSRFVNDKEINLVDLTLPSIENFEKQEYLILVPLIISSMIPVKDYDAIYKPEYLVPQLIVEWILKTREDKDSSNKTIHGVRYLSNHINNEFKYPEVKYINYAIPVFKPDSKYNYCKTLCEVFSLTKPTTNTIEKLKGGFLNEFVEFDKESYTEDEMEEKYYKLSEFGQLEKRLQGNSFPLGKIDCKRSSLR